MSGSPSSVQGALGFLGDAEGFSNPKLIDRQSANPRRHVLLKEVPNQIHEGERYD
jgi:hypothetical protein